MAEMVCPRMVCRILQGCKSIVLPVRSQGREKKLTSITDSSQKICTDSLTRWRMLICREIASLIKACLQRIDGSNSPRCIENHEGKLVQRSNAMHSVVTPSLDDCALPLQDRVLGFPEDARSCAVGSCCLKALGRASVSL